MQEKDFYGLHPNNVISQIIGTFEMIAYRRGLLIRSKESERVRGIAIAIMDSVLDRGGAGRLEPSGRRLSSRERDQNLGGACSMARKVAERAVLRAREGHAERIEGQLRVGDRVIYFRTNSGIFTKLCPPPLPPIC